jgi:hypothetical protein
MKQDSTAYVKEFMEEFASTTGLEPESPNPKRYLWTDAFAVCNYLELYNRTNEKKYLDLAIKLVDQVHHVLGKYRKENPKTGWISGLDKLDGEKHPTMGGLRIGKYMNERLPNEPFNERMEWDRDGQYYHYLTKWMHALNNISIVTDDVKYIQWALELGKTAQARFTYLPKQGINKRMYWKMSIDLTRPLVPSMGQHDPLDGFITYNEIQNEMKNFGAIKSPETSLELEIDDMKDICRGMALTTDDPLGIGGLLSDAVRLIQLIVDGGLNQFKLLESVLDSSIVGLRSYTSDNPMALPAEYRLAFRELGLSIGLKGLGVMIELIENNPEFSNRNSLRNLFIDIRQYLDLGSTIENFWMDEKNRQTRNWIEHRDINTVMLATTLAPEGFLKI